VRGDRPRAPRVDERFRSNSARVVNRKDLIPLLQDVIAGEPTALWRERLDAVGVPKGPINIVDQVVDDPQTAALGIIQKSADGVLQLVGLRLAFDGPRAPFDRRAPRLGEHNDEVFRSGGRR
jgi:crotonobetainyl-CoA:carnitine CoA-transferase CaiB-like acyl-CoA transferase